MSTDGRIWATRDIAEISVAKLSTPRGRSVPAAPNASSAASTSRIELTAVNSSAPRIEAKPTIHTREDTFEREADDEADTLMGATAPLRKQLSLFSNAAAGKDFGDHHRPRTSLIQQALVSPAYSLPQSTRAIFEPTFGFDFSDIRVHSDDTAARSAQQMGAPAYAVGRHIVFGSGCYDPTSRRGWALLAHELAHTVQQRDAWREDVLVPAGLRRSNPNEENAAKRAAAAVLGFRKPTLPPSSGLAIACGPDEAVTEDPAASALHDDEQFGDVVFEFDKHNSDLGDDVLRKIRSGMVKVASKSKTYEVAYSFFAYYSSFNHSLRKMTADEETKARKVDRKAETLPGVVFTTTTLRADVLDYEDQQLATLLLHEFSHTGHIAGDIAGGGSYQEGQSYGIEYFYSEVAGDSGRMKKIEGIVSAGEVLGYSKAATLGRFQEDFKVTYALLTGFREVVMQGSSAHLPFPDLTPAGAQLLEEQIVTSFQSPDTELAKYIAYAKKQLSTFKLPSI